MTDDKHPDTWWGDYTLEPGQAAKWAIGPLGLWLHRGRAEWRLRHEWEPDEDLAGWTFSEGARWPDENGSTERFTVRETHEAVRLSPLPCDRPVVARPKTSLRVLPGERARIFVSSPLWVEVAAGNGPTILGEIPTKRLSDTWFGASTREGELCYALKTSARTNLQEMPRAEYRVLTPIVLDNRGDDPLSVERLSLPVPYLTIYRSAKGETWSNEIQMVRTEGADMAALDVRTGAPVEAEDAIQMSQPREVASQGQLFRAFGSLLGFD